MMLLSLALSMTALADEAVPSENEIFDRLITEPAPSAPTQTAAPPWWMWPMGLLGVAGAAGVVIRNRTTTDGISDDIHVLSRAGLSRTASLTMIEVTGADGQTRRMLIGVGGGGAPRLVADLSTPRTTVTAEEDWFQEPVAEEPAPQTPARLHPKPLATPQAMPMAATDSAVGQRLSITTPQEPAVDPLRTPCGSRVAQTYNSRKPSGGRDGLNLVAEVLAERGQDESETESDPGWSDPWAKNFEALLGRRSV